MKHHLHYQHLQLDPTNPTYTPEQLTQDYQDIQTALALLNDPRLLRIFQQPHFRIHTLHYTQSHSTHLQQPFQPGCYGVVPHDAQHSIRINRTIGPQDFNNTPDDFVVLCQLAPTRTLCLASVVLHEMGHILGLRLNAWDLKPLNRIVDCSRNLKSGKVSPRCLHQRGDHFFPEYFPETLVGTLLYPERQLTLDPEGFRAVTDLLEALQE